MRLWKAAQSVVGKEVEEEVGGHLVAGTAVIRPISARQPLMVNLYQAGKTNTKRKM
jgi:hypothetical protein